MLCTVAPSPTDTHSPIFFLPSSNCPLSKLTDKVRWSVHSKLKPFHFQTKTYYLSVANYQTDNPSHTNNPSLVWNLGSWFDSQLSMSTHISKLCSSVFFHLHNISRIRKFLSPVETKSLVNALVTSRVDYCNKLLHGLPASQLNKVQRVLNTAARLVCCALRFSHITPLMYELHWRRLKQRVHFKILLFAFKAIHGIAPTYIQNLVSLYS